MLRRKFIELGVGSGLAGAAATGRSLPGESQNRERPESRISAGSEFLHR